MYYGIHTNLFSTQIFMMKRYMLVVFVITVIVLGHFCTDAAMARGLGAVGNINVNKLMPYILFLLKKTNRVIITGVLFYVIFIFQVGIREDEG